MKKRILLFSNDLDLGGIEKALLALLEMLDQSQYHITLVLQSDSGVFKDQLPHHIECIEYHIETTGFKLFRKIKNRFNYYRFILKHRKHYDFVISYAPYISVFAKFALAISNENALYIHSDYYYLFDQDVNKMKAFFDDKHVDIFKHLIFVSNQALDHFVKVYPELKDKTSVCGNLLSQSYLLKGLKEKPIAKPSTFTFVNISRHENESKRLDRLILAAKKLKSEGYKFNIWLIGDGKDHQMYQDMVKDNDLTAYFTFLGIQVNPYPYMKQADAYVLTSDYEGFPVVYIESLALKKPIITTINMSTPAFSLNELNSIIVEKTIDSIAEGMKEMITNYNQFKIDFDLNQYNKKALESLQSIIDEEALS